MEYTGATGIFFGYVQSSTIQHNLIANTSYSAMTIGATAPSLCRNPVGSRVSTDSAACAGWGWGRTGCRRGDNHVVANRIENPLRKRCCDGVSTPFLWLLQR